jgi:hypothetical protein
MYGPRNSVLHLASSTGGSGGALYVGQLVRSSKKQSKRKEDVKTLTIYPPFFYIVLWHEQRKKEKYHVPRVSILFLCQFMFLARVYVCV